MESVVINKTEWIRSAWWQDLEAQNKAAALKEAKKKIILLKKMEDPQESYNAFCIIESKSGLQAGFVERDPDQPIAEQKALAALFSANFDNCAIHLVFETGVWVCAIDDGLVLTDSDFFGAKEDANVTYNDFFHLREWDDIVQTKSHEESIALIEKLSNEQDKSSPLRPLTHDINIKRIIQVAIGLLCLVIAGYFFWTHWEDKKELEARELAAKRAEILKQLDVKNNQTQWEKNQFKKTWEFEPLGKDVFNFCLTEMHTFPIVDKGWLLDTFTCTKDKAKGQWKRLPYGRFTNLPVNAVFDANDPQAKFSISEWKRPMGVQNRQPGESLLKKSDGAARLYQIAKDYHLAISATWLKPEVRTLPAETKGEKPKKIISPYIKCVWTLTGKYCPEEKMINAMSDIPGVMVKEVIHVYEKEQWIIKGESYVQ